MRDNVFLDTNVLVYSIDSSNPDKQRQAVDLIEEALVHERGIVSTQVLSEFYTIVTRKLPSPLSAVQAQEIIETLEPLVAVDIDYPLVLRAIETQARYQISYWDGLIIAAAERVHCQTIYSEDLSDGQKYFGIQIKNPFTTHF